MKTKVCLRCKKSKPLSSFYVRPNGRPMSYCKKCNTARSRYNRYGLTDDQVAKVIRRQRGLCPICNHRLTRKFHIDHDHLTGEFRGLLHARCNLLLGIAGDDPKVLLRAIHYLQGPMKTPS